ncbi:hypothetical protein INT45_009657 [Circinella minor]|uniref:Retrotransposon gag domain-containing protein n=1 Tax=Circinella minor TaxID=1195481 RepID=A0A8H7RVM8_9FUNG|nr:hypothetical protein INT45_009657 [Circinella minor]
MEEQGIPQGSMQAVDLATQALQEVNNLCAELNSQLPAEMKKIYDAQGKMEGQVVQAISDDSRTVGKSSRNLKDPSPSRFSPHNNPSSSDNSSSSSDDENSLDINAESSHDSLDENSSVDDDKKDSHHRSHGQFRFKAPDEKYNGNSYKIESWLFNLEEHFQKAKIKESMWVDIATSQMVEDATLWWCMTNRSRLESLRQTSSVTKYNSTFQAAFVECNNVNEAEALSHYISGLKSQTKKYVELEGPRVLCKAMKLAENYDNASFGSYHSSSSHYKSHSRDSSTKQNKRHHHSRHSRDRGYKNQGDPMDIDQAEKTSMKLTWEQARKEGHCQCCGAKEHIKKELHNKLPGRTNTRKINPGKDPDGSVPLEDNSAEGANGQSSKDKRHQTIRIPGFCETYPCYFLLDSGATHNFVSLDFIEKHGLQHLLKPDKECITFGNETKANSSYFANVKIQFNQGYSHVIRVYTGIKSLKHDLILGKPWHFDEEPRINWKTHEVIVDGTNIQTQDNVDSQEIKPEVHFISH